MVDKRGLVIYNSLPEFPYNNSYYYFRMAAAGKIVFRCINGIYSYNDGTRNMSNNSFWHFLVENKRLLKLLNIKVIEQKSEVKDKNANKYIIKEDPNILP